VNGNINHPSLCVLFQLAWKNVAWLAFLVVVEGFNRGFGVAATG
jgi:hypothetical protein